MSLSIAWPNLEITPKKQNFQNISTQRIADLLPFTEAVAQNMELVLYLHVQRCSVKKVLLEISQNSPENTCARVAFFNKVAGGAFNFF